jgi:branched-chain amino acid transport system substrate-binding protein
LPFGMVMRRSRWAISGILLLGCQKPAPEIRIGVLVGATGEHRLPPAAAMIRSAQLAESLVNASGGLVVRGVPHRVRIILRDIGDQADLATSQARDLLNRDGVVALVGPQYSRDAIPVGSLAQQARVPMISPMSTHPQTTLGKSFVFRIAFLDDLQGRALATFARKTLHARRAALLYDVALDYSRNLARIFQAEFTALGGTVVADQQFTSDKAVDFTAQLTRIRAAHPDVIFAPNFSGADSMQLVQARRLGLTATFLGSDSWDPESLKTFPEAEGVYYAGQWHASVATPESDSYLAHYRQAYNATPDATGASTWDAFQVIFAAIQRAGSLDPDSIRSAIASTNGFRGATGILTYRTGGNPSKSVYLLRFMNGQEVFQQRIDP